MAYPTIYRREEILLLDSDIVFDPQIVEKLT